MSLKEARLARLRPHRNFRFEHLDVANRDGMAALFARERFDRVVHLAAQAGVRYSLVNPHAYIDANIVGFLNILEGCRHNPVQHLVYASSSSVYGANTQMPFAVHDNVDHPVSLYAATKKANELMAHCYSHLYGIPTTGLRFFTVYGPWGRPDMALFLFTKAILEGREIDVFNHGRMQRDFTYIDDIVEGVVRVTDNTATPNAVWSGDAPDPATSRSPYRIYNIGNNSPVQLGHMIEVLEDAVGRTARKRMLDMRRAMSPRRTPTSMTRARCGLPAVHEHRGGRAALRGLVLRLLPHRAPRQHGLDALATVNVATSLVIRRSPVEFGAFLTIDFCPGA